MLHWKYVRTFISYHIVILGLFTPLTTFLKYRFTFRSVCALSIVKRKHLGPTSLLSTRPGLKLFSDWSGEHQKLPLYNWLLTGNALPPGYKFFLVTVHSAWLCGRATWLLLLQVDDTEGFCRCGFDLISVVTDAYGNKILRDVYKRQYWYRQLILLCFICQNGVFILLNLFKRVITSPM